MDGDRAGIYLLVIAMDHPCTISIGALGEHRFPEGTYLYCGSALNGVRSRVARHLRLEKKIHWHVDHLLTEGRAVGAFVIYSDRLSDCQMARSLADMDGMHPHVRGFGSSDCRCSGHLFYADLEQLTKNWYAELLKGLSGP